MLPDHNPPPFFSVSLVARSPVKAGAIYQEEACVVGQHVIFADGIAIHQINPGGGEKSCEMTLSCTSALSWGVHGVLQ